MSEKFKLRYEVAAILKDNIQKGLEAFGFPISSSPDDGGWICMESDQPSFRNADNGILFWLQKTERIGLQSSRNTFNKKTGQYETIEYFIEQQIWKIRTICKRTTAPIADSAIPFTTDDVACMLVSWFNRSGCEEFRKHNMANLYIQTKDLNTYQGKSEVPQWVTEFPLKIQVIKEFDSDVESAMPIFKGAFPV